MIVYPAIDILGGRAVRLAQGDYERVTVYNEDPLAQARVWVEQGAEWLHVVDLDGARTGEPANIAHVERIAREAGVPVQVGGGIRSMETLRRLMGAGVSRAVLGTALVKDPALAEAAVAEFGDAVVAGIDARDGKAAVEGWREGTAVDALELARELASRGVRWTVYTDISRDGMQTGVDSAAYARLAEESGLRVIASGGVATLDDIRALAVTGAVHGAITGRAIYEGAFTLPDAIAAARGEG